MPRYGKPFLPDFSGVVLGALLLVRPLALWEPFAERVFILIGLLIAISMRMLSAGQAGRPFRLPPAGLFLGAIAIVAAAFALLRGPGVSKNGIEEMADLASMAVLFLLAYDAGADPARARRLIAVAMAALAVSSLHGLLQPIHILELRGMSEDEVFRHVSAADPGFTREQLPEIIARIKGEWIRLPLLGDIPRLFGTLTLPNLFGGFLAVLLPVALGLALDLFRRGTAGDAAAPGRRVPPLAALALAFPAFLLARSSGAYIALVGGAATFAALALRRLKPEHPAARLAPWALATLAATLALGFALLVTRPAPPGEESSFGMRIHYWKSGLQSFAEAPLLGHGLGRFGEQYMRFRAPEADESQRAHSAYVEWAVEGGVVLLALFLAWLAALGWRAVKGTADSDPPAPPPGASGTALPEGILAFLILLLFQSHVFDGVFRWIFDWTRNPAQTPAPPDTWRIIHAFLIASAIAFLPAAFTAAARAAGAWTRIGIVSGGAAFLIHASGELVAQTPGVFHTALALAAIAAAWTPGAPPRDARGRAPLALAFAALGTAFALMVGVWIPAYAAQQAYEQGPNLKPANQGELHALIRFYETARADAPRETRFPLKLADLYWKAFQGTKVRSAGGAFFSLHTQSLLEAIALEPGSAGLHAQFADSCDWASILARDPRTRDRNRAEAIRSFRRARALYPANPHYAARLAILLARSATTPAEKDAATAAAREALGLDARTTPLVQRLKLGGATQRKCEAIATGLEFERKPPKAFPLPRKAPGETPPPK